MISELVAQSARGLAHAKTFRELVKAEIAQTVGSGAEVQTELNYLVEVLSRIA